MAWGRAPHSVELFTVIKLVAISLLGLSPPTCESTAIHHLTGARLQAARVQVKRGHEDNLSSRVVGELHNLTRNFLHPVRNSSDSSLRLAFVGTHGLVSDQTEYIQVSQLDQRDKYHRQHVAVPVSAGTQNDGEDLQKISDGVSTWRRDPFVAVFDNPFSTRSLDPFATGGASNPYGRRWSPFASWGPFAPHPFENGTEQTYEPFVHVVTNTSQNTTFTVRLDIAQPNIIVSVYLLMFVPIGMLWVAAHHHGMQEKHVLIVLPMTYCSMIIGQDLVNQSLSVLMNSPAAITAIQTASLTVVTAVWTMVSEARKPVLSQKMLRPLAKWAIAAALFATYQLVNHFVSYLCSLSERTVFLNLCPLLSMACEATILPRKMQAEVSFSSKMALSSMVLGALLFSLQYPDFTANGMLAACLLIAVMMPYRLVQRWLLVECVELPVQVLACYDGLMCLVPSLAMSVASQNEFGKSWDQWLSNPSIAIMVALSWMTFTGGHISSLMMLRESSATNLLVFGNIANFAVVLLGIMYFGDKVVQSPMVFFGIIISLSSGVWYAVEVQSTRLAAS